MIHMHIINLIQEEIKRRLNSGNAFYHSVQNLLSSRLLSKSIKIRIYKILILPVVLYGCETWSLTLREEHRLRVFDSRVLRRIFGRNWDDVTGDWRKLHNEELHNLYSCTQRHKISHRKRMQNFPFHQSDCHLLKSVCSRELVQNNE
jgi:hypothetical protein